MPFGRVLQEAIRDEQPKIPKAGNLNLPEKPRNTCPLADTHPPTSNPARWTALEAKVSDENMNVPDVEQGAEVRPACIPLSDSGESSTFPQHVQICSNPTFEQVMSSCLRLR